MRVLVIEDNNDLRNYLRLALEALDFKVLTAENGVAALKYASDHRIDVALIDLFMPEMDGIETIAELRKRFPDINVIAMSGKPGDMYLNVARELGARKVLRKPFEINELISALRDLGPLPSDVGPARWPPGSGGDRSA
jgi:DNA-binding response OmpR family regulator